MNPLDELLPDGNPASKSRIATSAAADDAAVDEAEDESFPASDPRSSLIPDEPPANADAKWAAAAAADSTEKS